MYKIIFDLKFDKYFNLRLFKDRYPTFEEAFIDVSTFLEGTNEVMIRKYGVPNNFNGRTIRLKSFVAEHDIVYELKKNVTLGIGPYTETNCMMWLIRQYPGLNVKGFDIVTVN